MNPHSVQQPSETFAAWLSREMPPGTVISNPAWWAPRIERALARFSGQQAEPIDRQSLIDWVAEQWHAQVANRPMVNVHRRALDDTWRLMLRHLGVDDRARLGPTHDELRAEIGSKEWAALAGQQSERPAPAGQAVEALTKAREFVKSRKAPGYDGPCMDAIRNIDKGIAALAASQAERPAVKEKP